MPYDTLQDQINSFKGRTADTISSDEIAIVLALITGIKLNSQHFRILDKFTQCYPHLTIKKDVFVGFIDDLLGINLEQQYLTSQEASYDKEIEKLKEDIKEIVELPPSENGDTSLNRETPNNINNKFLLINIILIALILVTLLVASSKLLVTWLLSNYFFGGSKSDIYWWQNYAQLEKLVWALVDFTHD